MAKTKKVAARQAIGTDIGSYLRTLRVEKQIRAEDIAKDLGISYSTLTNIECGDANPPSPERLRLWMRALNETKRYPEAFALLRRIKTHRTVRYYKRHAANEHIDRIIDAYENYTLTDADIELLKLVAPSEYIPHEYTEKPKYKRAPSSIAKPQRGSKKRERS